MVHRVTANQNDTSTLVPNLNAFANHQKNWPRVAVVPFLKNLTLPTNALRGLAPHSHQCVPFHHADDRWPLHRAALRHRPVPLPTGAIPYRHPVHNPRPNCSGLGFLGQHGQSPMPQVSYIHQHLGVIRPATDQIGWIYPRHFYRLPPPVGRGGRSIVLLVRPPCCHGGA